MKSIVAGITFIVASLFGGAALAIAEVADDDEPVIVETENLIVNWGTQPTCSENFAVVQITGKDFATGWYESGGDGYYAIHIPFGLYPGQSNFHRINDIRYDYPAIAVVGDNLSGEIVRHTFKIKDPCVQPTTTSTTTTVTTTTTPTTIPNPPTTEGMDLDTVQPVPPITAPVPPVIQQSESQAGLTG